VKTREWLAFTLVDTYTYIDAVVIGGAHSNNVASLSQALIENGIKPTLMLLPGNNAAGTCAKGNALLTSLLVPKAGVYEFTIHCSVTMRNWHV
jgi:hypothetical protein